MPLNQLQLSLQFADIPFAARHRAALPRHKATRWIRHALSDDAEITVRIVNAEEGQRLNKTFRNKDYPTNVLTFEYAQASVESPWVLADLVLCAPVVAQEAKAQGKTLQAHYAHLLVHGTLHAQGWDHETSAADANEMEDYEIAILKELGLRNPYA
jgi:probable rRNA maturation factor